MKQLLIFCLVLSACNHEPQSSGVFIVEKSVDSVTWHPPYLCSWTENFPTCYNIAYKDTVIFAYPLKVVKKEESGAAHDSIKIEGGGSSGASVGGSFLVSGTMKLDIPGKGPGKVLTSDTAGVATWQVPSAAPAASPTIFTIVCDPLRLPAPADAKVYYYGTMSGTMSEAVNNQRFPIGFNCTLVGVTFATRSSLASSGEAATIYLRKNNQFDLALSSGILFNGGQTGNMYTVSGTAINENYSAGDYVELKLKCPTWATNPANIGIHTVLYFKTR